MSGDCWLAGGLLTKDHNYFDCSICQVVLVACTQNSHTNLAQNLEWVMVRPSWGQTERHWLEGVNGLVLCGSVTRAVNVDPLRLGGL